jgi:hypothetical protein
MSRREERTETISFSADSNNAPPRALRLRLTEMLAKCGLGASPASQECLGITRPGPFLRSGGGGCYPGSQNSQRKAGRRYGQGKAEKGKPGKSVGRGAP